MEKNTKMMETEIESEIVEYQFSYGHTSLKPTNPELWGPNNEPECDTPGTYYTE